MTEEELKEIEERTNAASPGPWHAENLASPYRLEALYYGDIRDSKYVMFPEQISLVGGGYETVINGMPADFKFIEHARTDIPKLTAEIRELKAKLASKPIESSPLSDEEKQILAELQDVDTW